MNWTRVVALCAIAVACTPDPAEAHEGWGIVRDAQGRLYIADIPANTVWRIDPDGYVEPVVRDVHTHALAIGADGAVYGSHVHLTEPVRGMWRLDMTGRLSTVIPQTRDLPLDLQPFLLASDGTVYSVSIFQAARPRPTRELFLLRRAPNGVVDTVAGGLLGHADGSGAEARFAGIDGMAWLPDSSILIVDGERLRRVTTAGKVETVTEILTQSRWDQDLLGASVDSSGSAYVADFAGRRVLKITNREKRTVAYGGWYWAPAGVLATPDGLVTLEHPRAPWGILGDLGVGPYLRVRMVRTDGSTEVLARRWGRHTKWVALAAGIAMVSMIGRAWARR